LKHLTAIPIQKLFIVTIVLKVTASGLGWLLRDPWILGFTVPLLIMTAYILIGFRREDSEVSDEKFADTCYYLGFIFTISSIIFSLFDLPHIGTKLSEIAVRFGAAMVSTVFGLVVRVYLVSFKRDIADAVEAAEVSVIDAASKFRDHLMLVVEQLKDFEHKVDEAARGTVHRVETQIEAVSKNHTDKLDSLFATLHQNTRQTHNNVLNELKQANLRVSASLDIYEKTMNGNIASIEQRVQDFANAINTHLKNTAFPDDFFASRLQGPLAAMTANIESVSHGIKSIAGEVHEANTALTLVTKNLKTKVTQAEKSVGTIVSVADNQQQILAQLERQQKGMQAIVDSIADLAQTLTQVTCGLTTQSEKAANLTQSINSLHQLPTSMSNLSQTLTDLVGPVREQIQASRDVTTQVRHLFDQTIEFTNVVAANNGRIHAAVGELPDITETVAEMRADIAAFGASLQALTEKLGNLEVTVNLSPAPIAVEQPLLPEHRETPNFVAAT
jgi:methyl-accepting chemotaxis protein